MGGTERLFYFSDFMNYSLAENRFFFYEENKTQNKRCYKDFTQIFDYQQFTKLRTPFLCLKSIRKAFLGAMNTYS